MIPIIPIITALLNAKVPTTAQTVKEFVTSKTNITASPLVVYGLQLLSSDALNPIGHAYLIGGVALIAIKDAIVKIKTPESS